MATDQEFSALQEVVRKLDGRVRELEAMIGGPTKVLQSAGATLTIGPQGISLASASGLEISVGGGAQLTVGGNLRLNVGAQFMTAVGSHIHTVAGANVVLAAGKELDVSAQSDMRVSSVRQMTFQAKNARVSAQDSVRLGAGGSQVSMKKDGEMTVTVKDLSVAASGKIDCKASKDLRLKGSKILQN